jgi:hypothetical protein
MNVHLLQGDQFISNEYSYSLDTYNQEVVNPKLKFNKKQRMRTSAYNCGNIKPYYLLNYYYKRW